jgi:hypothetical protein
MDREAAPGFRFTPSGLRLLVGDNRWFHRRPVMFGKFGAAKIVLFATLLWSAAAYAQTAEIWRSLGKRAMDTSIPAGLHVGEDIPDTMRLFAFDRHLRKKIPAIRSYAYALLQGHVLIVDRRARKIVSIVSE